MGKVRGVNQRPPGVLAGAESEAGQVSHMVQRGIVFEVSRSVNPQRRAIIPAQLAGQVFAPCPVEPEGIQEDIQLVWPQPAVHQILEQVSVERGAHVRQSPQALLENAWYIEVVETGLVEQALVVDQHSDLGGRSTVRVQEQRPEPFELSQE